MRLAESLIGSHRRSLRPRDEREGGDVRVRTTRSRRTRRNESGTEGPRPFRRYQHPLPLPAGEWPGARTSVRARTDARSDRGNGALLRAAAPLCSDSRRLRLLDRWSLTERRDGINERRQSVRADGRKVRAEGLEPPSLAAPAPKAGVSANFTTPAADGLHPTARHRLGPTCSSISATLSRRGLPRCEHMFARGADGSSGRVTKMARRGDWSNGEDDGLQNHKSRFDSSVPRSIRHVRVQTCARHTQPPCVDERRHAARTGRADRPEPDG
jgi:hypothetical protein